MHLPEDMDHNTFDQEEDLYKPFKKFLVQIGEDRVKAHPEESDLYSVFFEEKFYKPPQIILDLERKQAEAAQAKRDSSNRNGAQRGGVMSYFQ